MILPYLPRLVCIVLATYCLVHLALGSIVSLLARPAVRLAERVPPRLAALSLLALRLLPAAGAGLVVAALCLPSYLWLEPEAPAERVGFACLAVAALGVSMWIVSLVRGLRAAASSRRFVRRCERQVLDGPAPLLAIVGFIHPRLVISRAVLRSLPPDELAVALRHERAHWSAHDNLKRLLIVFTPSILPFAPASRTLEAGWSKFTEWAADDRAVEGSPRRACALAAALVRVARMAAHAPQPLAMSLLGDADQLAERVDRLLRPAPPRSSGFPVLALGGIPLVAAVFAVVILHPAALYAVHRALEHLVE